MKFLERFKQLINENGFTLSEVAQKTNLPRSTVSSYINRKSIPSAIQLEALADFFDVSVDYLIGREDDLGNVMAGHTCSPNTEDEEKLLSAFRVLDEADKDTFLIQITAIAKEKRLIKK